MHARPAKNNEASLVRFADLGGPVREDAELVAGGVAKASRPRCGEEPAVGGLRGAKRSRPASDFPAQSVAMCDGAWRATGAEVGELPEAVT